MRILLIILLLIHGSIHFLGFAKGFHLADIQNLNATISKPMGLIWLLSGMLFILASVLYAVKSPHWWIFALAAAMFSQVLVFQFWPMAKFATFPNLLILLICGIAWADFRFQRKISQEQEYVLNQRLPDQKTVITEELLVDLPFPVQNWLRKSGILGRKPIRSVQMKHHYQMKLKPEQSNWYTAKSSQVSTILPPALVWAADMKLLPLVHVSGRDKYMDGKGEMLFKIWSIFPVANEGDNPQTNEGALQRFLGEMVWYPSAALQEYIHWEGMDSLSAKATIQDRGLTCSGVFHFDENGNLLYFQAMRYMGSGLDARRHKWTVKALEHQTFDGITLPSKCEMTWSLDSGEWTWAVFEVKEVEFD